MSGLEQIERAIAEAVKYRGADSEQRIIIDGFERLWKCLNETLVGANKEAPGLTRYMPAEGDGREMGTSVQFTEGPNGTHTYATTYCLKVRTWSAAVTFKMVSSPRSGGASREWHSQVGDDETTLQSASGAPQLAARPVAERVVSIMKANLVKQASSPP